VHRSNSSRNQVFNYHATNLSGALIFVAPFVTYILTHSDDYIIALFAGERSKKEKKGGKEGREENQEGDGGKKESRWGDLRGLAHPIILTWRAPYACY
jgi:hypothetical protein